MNLVDMLDDDHPLSKFDPMLASPNLPVSSSHGLMHSSSSASSTSSSSRCSSVEMMDFDSEPQSRGARRAAPGKRRVVTTLAAGRKMKETSSVDIPVISRSALFSSSRNHSSPTLISSPSTLPTSSPTVISSSPSFHSASPTSSLSSPRLDSPSTNGSMVFPLPKEISQLGLQELLLERIGGGKDSSRLDSLDSLSSLESLDDLDSRLLPIELECGDSDVLANLSLPQEIEIEVGARKEVDKGYGGGGDAQQSKFSPYPIKAGLKKVILEERPFTPKANNNATPTGKVYLHL